MVSGVTNCNNVSIRRNTYTQTTVIISGFSVNILTAFNPCSSIPFIHSYMASGATITIITICCNCNNVSIRRNTYTPTTVITRGFSVNILTAFNPCSSIPCIHSYMASGATITIITICSNCNNISIRRNTYTSTTVITRGFSVNI